MKTPVAMVMTEQGNGNRTYSLFTRSEELVKKVTVADCGHGAMIARNVAAADYQISLADWATKLAIKLGVR